MSKNVVMNNSESFFIESKIIGYEFKIDIALPKGYKDSHETYPTIYVLDGNRNFGIAAGTARLLPTGMDAPDAIVVGVGYKTDEEHAKYRSRDYLPTTSNQLEYSGGGSNFLRFLKENLIPFIEEKYRVNQTRILSGFSYSALFTMYTLFTDTSLFKNYLIGSPSLFYDDKVMFKIEAEYAKKFSDLDAKVFLSVGTLEEGFEMFPKMVSNVERISEILLNRNYSNLQLTTHIFDNETHFSSIPATFSRGVRVLIGSLSK